ncbi:MAG: endonuclease/exonuclease/phosphatase family protein [Planctomycetota bacterium]
MAKGNKWVSGLLWLAVGAGLLVTALSFLGSSWWFFDILAHFRVQAVVIFVLGIALALLLGGRKQALAGALGLAVQLGCAWPYLLPAQTLQAQSSTLKVLLSNVLTRNADHQSILETIQRENPDVIVLLEVSEGWLKDLLPGLEAWPHRDTWPRDDNFGLAFFSRIPFADRGPTGLPRPAAHVQFDWQGRSIPLLGFHPFPPIWGDAAAERDVQMESVGRLSMLADPMALVIADFNASPWSVALEPLRQNNLRDARRGFGFAPTWPTYMPWPLRIPIDHVYVGEGWQVLDFRVLEPMGSDHHPVVATLAAKP